MSRAPHRVRTHPLERECGRIGVENCMPNLAYFARAKYNNAHFPSKMRVFNHLMRAFSYKTSPHDSPKKIKKPDIAPDAANSGQLPPRRTSWREEDDKTSRGAAKTGHFRTTI